MEKLVFSLLVFLAPTQLALHFWPNWTHIFGIRVDYLAPTIYLTDVLVGLLFVGWLVRSKHKIQRNYWFVILLLIAILNLLFAKGVYPAVFKWVKVFEFAFLGYYAAREKKFDLKGWFLKPLTLSILVFSSIGIIQFLIQRTIGGPLYLLGERSFTIATPGVALVSLLGREFLRPYSTFPHPNAFAGYLAVSSFLIFLFLQKKGRLEFISLATAALGIILSFSLGAFMSIAFATIFYLIVRKYAHLAKILIYFLFLMTLSFSLVLPALNRIYLARGLSLPESVYKRLSLSEKSGEVFSESPILGAGLNNFLVVSKSLQPVHNIFLLVLAETGIAGLLIFCYLFFLSLKKSLFTNHYSLITALIVILITGAVDHYWLTLQQNQLLLSFIFGLSFRKKL